MPVKKKRRGEDTQDIFSDSKGKKLSLSRAILFFSEIGANSLCSLTATPSLSTRQRRTLAVWTHSWRGPRTCLVGFKLHKINKMARALGPYINGADSLKAVSYATMLHRHGWKQHSQEHQVGTGRVDHISTKGWGQHVGHVSPARATRTHRECFVCLFVFYTHTHTHTHTHT